MLEDFLPEVEAKLLTLEPESGGEAGVAAVEDGDLPLPLLPQLAEHFVPVWPPGVHPGLQSWQ